MSSARRNRTGDWSAQPVFKRIIVGKECVGILERVGEDTWIPYKVQPTQKTERDAGNMLTEQPRRFSSVPEIPTDLVPSRPAPNPDYFAANLGGVCVGCGDSIERGDPITRAYDAGYKKYRCAHCTIQQLKESDEN